MSEKIREEFEVWVKSRWPDTWLDRIPEGNGRLYGVGNYWAELPQLTWEAWQASRAAIEVALPEENPIGKGTGDHGDGRPSFEQQCAAECNCILQDCREAIESIGLKVKP